MSDTGSRTRRLQGQFSPGSARDEALGRLRRITKDLAVATLAAVGALSTYVANTTPGRAAASRRWSRLHIPRVG